MEKQVRTFRDFVIDTLELISSESEQLEFEKNVPHVDITVELVCDWFDDSYYPGESGFLAEFNDNELEALAHFNKFYDERLDMLPESEGTVQTWLQNEVWKEIMHEAKSTLEKLKA